MRGMIKFFGIVTVGERGQIVIPKEARETLKIKKGDKMIVLSSQVHTKKLTLIPADDFANFISEFEKDISAIKGKIDKGKSKKKR